MVQKRRDSEPGEQAPISQDHVGAGSEFENAVTSEISGLMQRAFPGEKAGLRPGDIKVTDASISTHVDRDDPGPFAAGDRLNDRFEIVERVHSGGMAHVYKAIDHRRQFDLSGPSYVAIKTMRQSLAAPETLQAALEREAARAQGLAHPNIVTIFDFDRHEEHFYLVMQWLDGETVNDLLRRTSGEHLATEFAWQLIEEVAAGLHHAHVNNVVHADINPSNIFITSTHRIKLLDFGVARDCSEQTVGSDERLPWVTQPYASPEVLTGLTPVVEDDVFSLACVAYRLLGGSHPFDGTPSILAKQRGDRVKAIAGVAETDWQFLERALSYERKDRPHSVAPLLRNARRGGEAEQAGGHAARPWLGLPLAAAVGAVALLVGGWWLTRGEPAARVEPAGTSRSAAGPVDTANSAIVDAALAGAALAISEQRYVEPADNNARDFYRAVLAVDPGNATAMSGLREISDRFVQQAEQALRDDDPQRASVALDAAADTDPANPAVGIVQELLVATGDKALADARLAVAVGDTAAALALLSSAERYDHVDGTSINAMRRQIAAGDPDKPLLRALTTADEHIAAGRLLAPEGNNAHAALMQLYPDYRDDPRLLASSERLGVRLLTRAAFATAAGQFAEAATLLDAAGSLGVLGPEVASARASLDQAAQAAAEDERADAESASAASDEPSVDGRAIAAAAGVAATQLANPGGPTSGRQDGEGPTRAAADENAMTESAETTAAAGIAAGAAAAGLSAGGSAAIDESFGSDLAGQAGQTTDAPAGTDAGPSVADGSSPPAAVASNAGAAGRRSGDTASAGPAAAPGRAADTRPMSIYDLGLEEFIPPRLPRRALRWGITGFVEIGFDVNPDGSTGSIEIVDAEPGNVFESSAIAAVEQWRFAERDDVYRAVVKLRFEKEP